MQSEPTHRAVEHIPSRHLDAPVIAKDLSIEAASLRREDAFLEHGHSAKTLAKYPDLRVVLMVFKQEAALGWHETAESICIQAMKGRVRVLLPNRQIELPPGSLVTLEQGKRHDVLALEDADVLLIVAWKEPRLGGGL